MPAWSGVVVAVDEVGRLVAVEPDAVAGAVGQAGQPVARAAAVPLVEAPHRIVDRCPTGTPTGRGRRSATCWPRCTVVPDLALPRSLGCPSTKVRETSDW